jgi:A/G-specific adenine glycosylase
MSDPGPAARQRALLSWYLRNRRALPWRADHDAYRVWVSEVMLQQTTVKAVVPYYERFLARFPDPATLAAAPEDDVLAAWSGLGYYHRARNLRRGAAHVALRHAGVFPRTLEAALAVPGVGLYTASAILSIAYGVKVAVVDGNVKRVVARLFGLEGPTTDAAFYNHAQALLDTRSPGDWNQAVMELGATVCTPRAPACPACPVAAGCLGRASGDPERFPEPRARRATVDVTVAAALVRREGRVLLVRRPGGRLMGGMWELPQTTLESHGLPDLVAEMRERHGLAIVPGALLADARHAITFRRIRVEAYEARLARGAVSDPERFRWAAPEDLDALATSSLTRKVLKRVRAAQMPLPLVDSCR